VAITSISGQKVPSIFASNIAKY